MDKQKVLILGSVVASFMIGHRFGRRKGRLETTEYVKSKMDLFTEVLNRAFERTVQERLTLEEVNDFLEEQLEFVQIIKP